MDFKNCKVLGVPAKYWENFFLEWDDPEPDPKYDDPTDDICWTTWRRYYWQESNGTVWMRKSHTGHTEGCFWTEEKSEEIELEDFCKALVDGFIEGILYWY